MVSIVIPTFNEMENVQRIAASLGAVMAEKDYEIIFVDDSNDQTPSILNRLAENDRRIRVFHRAHERGLATAVILGFSKARGEIICVMDADLQHPPEIIPKMLFSMENGADLVIPSRFIPGGSDGGLLGTRKLISWGARCIAWFFLKKARLSTDPLSGFFMLRKTNIQGVRWNPVGWKILLEILVKASFSRLVEIPYRFKLRDGGVSKMGWKEQFNYLCHIYRLVRSSPSDMRFWKFSLVGLSGVAVNLVIYICLTRFFQFTPVLSGALAAMVAILSNFLLNQSFTWPDSGTQRFTTERTRHLNTNARHLALFYLFSGIGILINLSVLYILTQFGRVDFLTAQILAIAVATIWNFTANSRFNWKETPAQTSKETVSQNEESSLA